MMEKFLRLIRGRVVGEIFVGVSMMRVSQDNCGLTMISMVPMGCGRRMKAGAKHREQHQELENNAAHRARLAEQCSHSKRLTYPAPVTEHAEVLPERAWTRRR